MDLLLDILTALGLGAAAGLAPFVAIASVVLLAALHVGLNPEDSGFSSVTDGVAVVIAALVLVQSFLANLSRGGLRLRVAADRPGQPLLLWLVAALLGGLAGAVLFSAEGEEAVVGAVAAALGGVLVAFGFTGFFKRVGERMDRTDVKREAKGKTTGGPGDRRALAIGVDITAIVAVVLTLLVPPVGLVLPVLAVLMMYGDRRREAKKYEGLRSLR